MQRSVVLRQGRETLSLRGIIVQQLSTLRERTTNVQAEPTDRASKFGRAGQTQRAASSFPTRDMSEPATPAAATTDGAAPPASAEGEPPMSKSRMKKLRKQAEVKAKHAERKAREKAKRAELRAKRDAGEIPPDALPPRKKRKIAPAGTPTPFNARVVIDLGFDDKMNEKVRLALSRARATDARACVQECKSLSSQLAYVYNSNRKSMNPFASLLFTTLNGKTHARLESLADGAYKRWARTEWWEDGYEKLWADDEPGSEPRKTKAPRETVVYLTADAEEDLEVLKEGETYIIGGICDHNRYKVGRTMPVQSCIHAASQSLCYNKSKGHAIRSARLPIGKYIDNLPSRKVLTVNQVRCWPSAYMPAPC